MDTNEVKEFKVYPFRWFILTMFALLEMGNALMWVTYSPISNIASNYFGGGYYGSTTSVNMLANIFLILYAPGSILAVLMMKHYKLRNTLIIGGCLTVLGALLRYIAALCNNDLGHEKTYILMFLGQALGAISQPMFLNLPPALASIWFPVHERDLSTTIGSMCSPIGNAIGQLIPVILVSQRQDDPLKSGDDGSTVHGMADLMLVEFVFCVIPLICAIFYFKDAPPTPPSQSTLLKIKKQTSNRDLTSVVSGKTEQDLLIFHTSRDTSSISLTDKNSSSNGEMNEWDQFINESHQLFTNRDYVLLFIAFSIGVGFFNALLTLLNQMIEPFGYSNDDAGTFGAVFIFLGLIGAGIVASIMEKTKKYRTILKSLIGVCILILILFLCMLYSDNFWPLLALFGILGLFLLPLLPVMMENCAECTYPIPEELSMGYMFVGCNLSGLGFTFALQYLLQVDPLGPPPFLPANIFIVGVMGCACLALYFYNGQYKRLAKELRNSIDDPLLSNHDHERAIQ